MAINDNTMEMAIHMMVVHLLPGHFRLDIELNQAGYQGGEGKKNVSMTFRRVNLPGRSSYCQAPVTSDEDYWQNLKFKREVVERTGMPHDKKDSGRDITGNEILFPVYPSVLHLRHYPDRSETGGTGSA